MYGAVSVGSSVSYAGILIIGGFPTALTQIPAFLISDIFLRKLPFYRALFNASLFVLAAGVSGLVYRYSGGTYLSTDFRSIIFPSILCAISYFLINTNVIHLLYAKVHQKSIFRIWQEELKWEAENYLVFFILGLILAYVFIEFPLWVFGLFFLVLLASRYLFKESIIMKKIYLDTITGLTTELETFDPYTHGHSRRVTEYALTIGKALKLSEDELEHLRYACLLHDIGKVSVPEEIINKPGRLTENEYQLVKQHVKVGVDIIKQLEFLEAVSPAIRYHHERVNGKGYPYGVKQSDLPLFARIIAVADGFDAMTSERPYRGPLSKDEAIEELKKYASSQFDPHIVEIFVRIIEDEKHTIDKNSRE